jgi:phage portal protein BeeE
MRLGTILFWECNQSARPAFIAPQDVVHMAWEGGRGDIGVSPLSYLGNTLRTEDASQRSSGRVVRERRPSTPARS